MLVHPSKRKMRSRPTRIYLERNSPKLHELDVVPSHAQERKQKPRRSPLRHFKLSVIAVFLLITFHWSYRPTGTRLQKDDAEISSKLPLSTSHPSGTSPIISNDTITLTRAHLGRIPGHSFQNVNWKRPLVDRAMLEMADGNARIQYKSHDINLPADSVREPTWRPTVWEIPKKRHRLARLPVTPERSDVDADIPNPQVSTTLPIVYSPTEKFLLPFRIAEQESRARMHLSQLIRLAKELNRTLVLPNVGKSRIGACYHWGFEMYYDLESLAGHKAMKPDEFKAWVARHPSASSRVVSIKSESPQDSESQKADPPSHEDMFFRTYQGRTDPKSPSQLPTCMVKRFPRLQTTHQASWVFVNEDSDARAHETRADSFIAILKSVAAFIVESDAVITVPKFAEPDVLIVDWNLRHPVFGSTPTLHYSPKLHELARRVGPQDPYVAVHWRTETVAPDILSECAYALIEILGDALRDETRSMNFSTIWLASDYPRAIRQKDDGEYAQLGKSGTYKRLTGQLEDAIDILRESFSEEGPLHDWSLRDLFDVQKEELGDSEWLLEDIGARGILDKLISINAKTFIRGSKSCSRHSSYTGQIIQARAARGDFEDNIFEVLEGR